MTRFLSLLLIGTVISMTLTACIWQSTESVQGIPDNTPKKPEIVEKAIFSEKSQQQDVVTTVSPAEIPVQKNVETKPSEKPVVVPLPEPSKNVEVPVVKIPAASAGNWTETLSRDGIRQETIRLNDASLILFRELAQKGENTFLSPYSISSAFAMLYMGAAGETAHQMENVFGFTQNSPAYFSLSSKALEELAKKNDTTLDIANSIWPDSIENFTVKYISGMKKYFRSQIYPVNYRNNAEGAVRRINDWVAENTNDKIKNLLSADSVNANTRLVLVNAIYFTGEWRNPFSENTTHESNFYPSPGKTIKVKMMNQKGDFGYFETEQVQGLEMPYKNGRFSMLFLLPRNVSKMPELLNSINSEQLAKWEKTTEYGQTIVAIPKFKLDYKVELNQLLVKLGMKDAFSTKANFSGINGKRDLFVDFAIHQAFLKIDEKGSEAAAATAVGIARMSLAPKANTFKADRPFIVLLRDNDTKTILFAGLIVNPEF